MSRQSVSQGDFDKFSENAQKTYSTKSEIRAANYATKGDLAAYQVKGSYALKSDLRKYQSKGDYQPAGDYALKSTLGGYQPKGNYQPAGDYALNSTLGGYQPKGNYALKDDLSGYQPKGDYALNSTLAGYQPKGDYAIKSEIVAANYATKGDLGAYQPKGDFQLRGDYAVKSDLAAFQPKGEYLLKSEFKAADPGPAGPQGPAGKDGSQGPIGPAGPAGEANFSKGISTDGNVNVKGDIAFNGVNPWIIHTPDDDRKTMYIAPKKADGSDWDWSKQTIYNADGSVNFSGSISAAGGNVAGKLGTGTLRVENGISMGGQGEFSVDYPDVPGGRFVVDNQGNIKSRGDANIGGNVSVASGKAVNIRDQFHGMSFKDAYDGPAVYGYAGGALGTSQQDDKGGYKESLRWNRDGDVNVTGKFAAGKFSVNNDDNGLTIKANAEAGKGRMHITSEDELYVLNKKGVVIGKEWGGNGNLNVQGDTNIGGNVSVASGKAVNIRDQFHGMSFKDTYDGPAVYGYAGGALGTSQQDDKGGYKESLRWNRDGDVTVARNAFVGDNVIMSGKNSWILHTPDDGRKQLYVAPGADGGNWDWSKQTQFMADGNVNVSGNITAAGRNILGEIDELKNKSAVTGAVASDFDAFSNGDNATFSKGWKVGGDWYWDPSIRGPGRGGFAHTEKLDGLGEDWDDNDTSDRTADIAVPAGMKSGFLFHLPWVNCRHFDIYGLLANGKQVFIRRVNAFQNVKNESVDNFHDAAAVVPITRVDRFASIRIKGVRGRIHYMGTGWTKNNLNSYASGADSGFVSAQNIVGGFPKIVVGDNITPPNDWRGANFKRKDGSWTHFDWKDDGKNYIRGDTQMDGHIGMGADKQIKFDWDTDGAQIGLKNNGDNRKDLAIIWADDDDDRIRFIHRHHANGEKELMSMDRNSVYIAGDTYIAGRNIIGEIDGVKRGIDYNLIRTRNDSNRCLDIESASKDNGAKVQIWDCHKGANQQIMYNQGSKQLIFQHSGKCVDVEGGADKNGTQIQQWDCDKDNWNQKFTYDGAIQAYRWATNPNRCIDIDSNNRANGGRIQLHDCNSSDAQRFI